MTPLEPSAATCVAIERQKVILAAIRENPLGSFVFSGAPGVGKTTMLRELERCSRAALWKNHCVYSATMMEFQRNTTAKARGIHAYAVDAESLRTAPQWGGRYSVFFDDFDKVNGTEFMRLHLFDVVNTIVETNAQLALTTNMTKEEFTRFFADTVAWRVFRHCVWVEMTREVRPAPAAQPTPEQPVSEAQLLAQRIHHSITEQIADATIPADWLVSWTAAMQSLLDAGHTPDLIRAVARFALAHEGWAATLLAPRGAVGLAEKFDSIHRLYVASRPAQAA